jgi:hypothetical protein
LDCALKKSEKVVFWGGDGANEIAAPHFGPRFFQPQQKGVQGLSPKNHCNLLAINCGKLWHFEANCGKLRQIAANCSKMWQIAVNWR